MLSTLLSPRDMAEIARVAMETPALHFEIIYGVSRNSRSWWDTTRAEALGYVPKDSADEYAAEVLAKDPPEEADALALRLQGGVFASAEFTGDPAALAALAKKNARE